MNMYFKPETDEVAGREAIEVPLTIRFTLYLTSMAVILIGIIPTRIIQHVSAIIGF
jgi:hypothetical protein